MVISIGHNAEIKVDGEGQNMVGRRGNGRRCKGVRWVRANPCSFVELVDTLC
jgi:hypothetical protein